MLNDADRRAEAAASAGRGGVGSGSLLVGAAESAGRGGAGRESLLVAAVRRVEAAAEEALALVSAGDCSCGEMREMLAVSKAAAAKLSAAQTAAAAAIAGRERHGDGGAEVLAGGAGVERHEARRHIKTAAVIEASPAVRDAVESGRVSKANARRLADAIEQTSAGAVESDAELLANAESMRPEQFADKLRRWTADHQDDGGEAQYRRLQARRSLRVFDGDDGMMHLRGEFDPVTGIRIANRLRAQARRFLTADKQAAKQPGAGNRGRRSVDQCMADALDNLTAAGTAAANGNSRIASRDASPASSGRAGRSAGPGNGSDGRNTSSAGRNASSGGTTDSDGLIDSSSSSGNTGSDGRNASSSDNGTGSAGSDSLIDGTGSDGSGGRNASSSNTGSVGGDGLVGCSSDSGTGSGGLIGSSSGDGTGNTDSDNLIDRSSSSSGTGNADSDNLIDRSSTSGIGNADREGLIGSGIGNADREGLIGSGTGNADREGLIGSGTGNTDSNNLCDRTSSSSGTGNADRDNLSDRTSSDNGTGSGTGNADSDNADRESLIGSGDSGGNASGTNSDSGGGCDGSCGGGRPLADICVVAHVDNDTGELIAELPNGTRLPDAVLDELACNAKITGAIFDRMGKAIWRTQSRRTVTDAQWQLLIAKWGGCFHCGANPGICQGHHIDPASQGGPTKLDNLVPACWECHHRIHHHGWWIQKRPDGNHTLHPPDPANYGPARAPEQAPLFKPAADQAPNPRLFEPAVDPAHVPERLPQPEPATDDGPPAVSGPAAARAGLRRARASAETA